MSKITDIKKWKFQTKRKKELREMFYAPETEHTLIALDRKDKGFLELRDALDKKGYDYKVVSYIPEGTKINNLTDEDIDSMIDEDLE